jgi:hypothetical protein
MKSPLKFALTGLLLLFTASGFASAKPREPVNTATPQLLTYNNIVRHFKSAGLRTTEVQKRCTIFFEGRWQTADIYNYALILVENSDEDIQVTFYLTDAHEMNWVTEFLDAPFFAPNETQALFDVVNSGRDAREKGIGRFRVDFHRWEPRHAQILVFSFIPAQKARN